MMIDDKVNQIIAAIYGLCLNTPLGVPEFKETSLLTSLGDSLDLVELVFALEAEFKFPEIEEKDVESWKTVTDVINYCYNHTRAAKRVEKTKRAVESFDPRVPDDIRANGWSVAIHNDYKQFDLTHTFWLFTKDDHCVKGEGHDDAQALNAIRYQLHLPTFV